MEIYSLSFKHIKKNLYNLSLFPCQSPEETDKDNVHRYDSERKMNPDEKDSDVYTEKHPDSLFKRTEVLAGEQPGRGQVRGPLNGPLFV